MYADIPGDRGKVYLALAWRKVGFNTEATTSLADVASVKETDK